MCTSFLMALQAAGHRRRGHSFARRRLWQRPACGRAVIEFASGKEGVGLLYSVCYSDEGGNAVLSHKTEADLEELRGRYGDVRTAVFAVYAGALNGGSAVSQLCWKHESELVEGELKRCSEKEALYIPSYVQLPTPNIRVRKYERGKQGDSALCAPIPKPSAAAGGARAPAATSAARTTSESKTSQPKLFGLHGYEHVKNEGTHKKPKVEAPPPAAAPSRRPAEAQEKATATRATQPAQPRGESAATSAPSGGVGSTQRDFKSFVSQKLAQPSSSAEAPSSQAAPAAISQNDAMDTSLFACDDPCDAMELDDASCNDRPVSYVEKVTRENTYVDSGYFVVEENDEYVQVNSPARSLKAAPPKHGRKESSADDGRKGLLKKPQKQLKQMTLTYVRCCVRHDSLVGPSSKNEVPGASSTVGCLTAIEELERVELQRNRVARLTFASIRPAQGAGRRLSPPASEIDTHPCRESCWTLSGRSASCRQPAVRQANFRLAGEGEAAAQGSSGSVHLPLEPVVAIVGRPNVGKSSIFNRISKQVRRHAICLARKIAQFHRGSIVSESPGTTRDRQYALADWEGRTFRLIDTGGLEDESEYAESIRAQVGSSLEHASVALVVVDGQAGLTDGDLEVRDFVLDAVKKRGDLRVLLCVNKCESFQFGDVLAEVGPHSLPWTRVRPNCGKSSLVNLLAGSSRCLVSPKEGTTLDTVEVPIVRGERRYLLIDTAGMRLQSKDRRSFLPKGRSLRAIRKSDVCVLVVDASWGISRNDVKLAEEIRAESRAAVIVCNKWDLVDKDPTVYKNAVNYVKEKLHWLDYADVVFTSAKTAQRVSNVLGACQNAHDQFSKSFTTALLNEVLREATFLQKPPVTHGKRLSIYYVCQVHSQPPGIALFCNDERLLTDDYAEYLEVFFRRSLNLTGSPIRWYPRAKRARHSVPDLRNRASKSSCNSRELLSL
ncbi:ribosome-associated GTPase [Babesia ovata]|uniref:GTPase Der n=1 Tax=Babesia ovata TaxID=189622 RepID=A0A2H6KHD1_9APIC|nr:ribosome-associated GTPase [Babesia ovata]GBE62398.1 ribosome-associated GTPase [Babesia ovata]